MSQEKFVISPELWEWLLVANAKLNRNAWCVYSHLLFAWVHNNREPVSFCITELANDLDFDRHTLGSYLIRLHEKRWITRYISFGKEQLLFWCRTSLDEKSPPVRGPGIRLKQPDGSTVRVPVSEFAEFAREHNLPDRAIEYMKRRFDEGKPSKCKNRETGEMWSIEEVYDYYDSSFPYSHLFGKTRQEIVRR